MVARDTSELTFEQVAAYLHHDPEVGYFLADEFGQPRSAVWFSTEDEATDYCARVGWLLMDAVGDIFD
jgi:hypothetical protein